MMEVVWLDLAGLPWGWHFNPHTHPIPTGIPMGIPIPTAALRLGLCTLELRRLHFDLIFCYKIVFGLVHVNCDDFFHLCYCS